MSIYKHPQRRIEMSKHPDGDSITAFEIALIAALILLAIIAGLAEFSDSIKDWLNK